MTNEHPTLVDVDPYRAAVVEHAVSQLGETDSMRYWREPGMLLTEPSESYRQLAWCGVFALWCLRKAGLTDLPWTLGKGFVWPARLPVIDLGASQPGDIWYYDHPYQHHAICEGFGPGGWSTIAGNVFCRVARSHGTAAPHGLTVFSIRQLVDSAHERDTSHTGALLGLGQQ
jgi:hypothetical protein